MAQRLRSKASIFFDPTMRAAVPAVAARRAGFPYIRTEPAK
jgi:hypothetical protein